MDGSLKRCHLCGRRRKTDDVWHTRDGWECRLAANCARVAAEAKLNARLRRELDG